MKILASLTKNEQILSCPFCGGEAIEASNTYKTIFYVECKRCGAATAHRAKRSTARGNWNRRDNRFESTLGQIAGDGCGNYHYGLDKTCMELTSDKAYWCWSCIAKDALEFKGEEGWG